MSELIFCTVVKDRTTELKKVVRRHAPYADRSIVVLHRRNAQNEAYIQSQECKDLRVQSLLLDVPYHPPTMRNAYLSKLPPGAWAFHMDCDEFMDEVALYRLREIVEKADAQGFNRVAYRPHDIRIGLNGEVWDNLAASHYTPLLFKVFPGICWSGETHGGLHVPGVAPRIAQVPFHYFHIKTTASEYLRGCHNYWTTGECAQNNPNVPEWKEFKALVAAHGFKDFSQLYPVMVDGKLPEDVKRWIITNRDNSNPEARSWFIVYFGLLHPEQNTFMAGNKEISYDKDRKPYAGEMTF